MVGFRVGVGLLIGGPVFGTGLILGVGAILHPASNLIPNYSHSLASVSIGCVLLQRPMAHRQNRECRDKGMILFGLGLGARVCLCLCLCVCLRSCSSTYPWARA